VSGDLTKKGTLAFFVKGKDADWATNDKPYSFKPFTREGISAIVSKGTDRGVYVEIAGPFGNSYDFRVPLPACDHRGLHVALTWEDESVTLYLNGEKVKSQSSPHKAD
jgi:hypothetical protein